MTNEKAEAFNSLIFVLSRMKKIELPLAPKLFEVLGNEYNASAIVADNSKEEIKSFSLFGSKEAEYDDMISFSGLTGDGGMASVEVYLKKGMKWSDEDRKDLEIICCTLYNILGKLRLMSVADHLYFFDSATGLPNINLLMKTITPIFKQGRSKEYNAYFVNIKGTNYINRKISYKYGTEVFRCFGGHFLSMLDDDEIFCRLGGDNFVLVAKKEKHSQLMKDFSGISVNVCADGKNYTFNVCSRVGILEMDKYSIMNPGQMMDKVTITGSYGKLVAHSDIVYCTDEIIQNMSSMKKYSTEFRQAVENHDFEVYYQPKVKLDTGEIYGAEALVRWKQENKMMLPGEFIPYLEKEHLICELDFYVLRQVCEHMSEWREKGIVPVKISVNFSNEHLYNENTAEAIIKTVDEYSIPHSLFEIEVTETTDPVELQTLDNNITALQMAGMTVAIDDFGTGYSSLSLIQNINADVVKIDKSLVSAAENGFNRTQTVLRNMINMANELGIEVVAEGVETWKQAEGLNALSCVRIQGFLFDEPLPYERFSERIMNGFYTVKHD